MKHSNYPSPLINQSIPQLLEKNASEFATKEAVVYETQNIRLSWTELKQQVDRVARALLNLGISRGDHIAIWGTNRLEWLLVQIASGSIGATIVTINPEWKAQEIEYALKQSDTNLLVMMPGFEKVGLKKVHKYDYLSIIRDVIPELQKTTEEMSSFETLPELRKIVFISETPAPGLALWKDVLEQADSVPLSQLNELREQVQPEDQAMIQYTSGTTGFPKGVMLSQFNIVNNANIVARNMHLSERDKICAPVPYYHCFGSILVNVTSLVTGATMVIPAEHFDAHATLEAIDKERCTVLYGVPTMFWQELDQTDFNNFDLSSLRTGIMAGAPCPRELMINVIEKMGAKEMTIAYGLTETSPVTHQTSTDDPVDIRVSTIGRPIEHTEAKIVDPGTLKELPNGEVGEIWIKGFQVMKGYYKKPEETAETIVDGWLRSGDLGTRDDNNNFRIAGRLKEMLIVGGHNVYPVEVEQALLGLFEEEIEIVQIVGVPDKKMQEVSAAVVMLHKGQELTAEQLKEVCKDKMEWPKVPRYIVFVDDWAPYQTVTGKIQKFKLRKMLVEKFGLEE